MATRVVGCEPPDRQRVVAVQGHTGQVFQLVNDGQEIQTHVFGAGLIAMQGGPIVPQVVAAPLNGINFALNGEVNGIAWHQVDSVVVANRRFQGHANAVVQLVITLCCFHDRSQGLNMAVAVNVVLAVLWNPILETRLIGQHVVALTVRGRLLQNVSNIKGRQVRVGLKHESNGSGHTGRGHACAAEGDITVAGVVRNRHHVRTHERHVGLDAPFFGRALAAVFCDGRVLVERTDRDHVFGTSGRSDGGWSRRVSCGDEHADSGSNHLVGKAVDAVFLRRGPLDWSRSTEAHGCGSNVVFVAVIDRPLHAGHDHGKAARAARVEDLHANQEGAGRHAGVFEGRCAGACNGTCTVGAVTLVVVGEDFGAVDLVGIVDRVIKSDDFRVIGAVVVVHVVKANVEAVDACVDDRHGHA